jgi:phosphatidate cytidylyltransferase
LASGTATRVLTAAVLIPIVVAAIWLGPTWLVAALAAVVAVFALLEFMALGEPLGFRTHQLWTCLAAVGIVGQQWYAAQYDAAAKVSTLASDVGSPKFNLEMVLLVYVLGYAVIILSTKRPLREALGAVSISSAGLVTVVLPFSAVVRLHAVELIGPQLLLFTVVLVWAGDTAAYFAGNSFGRTKMAPQVSPNKSWEGAIANIVASLIVGAAFAYWMEISLAHVLVMALFGSIAGQIGDLFKSAFKRAAGVKDSGTILPGHGGVLDRIDSLILAAPVVWYYFEWIAARTRGL